MTDINKLKLLINAEIIENRSNYALFNEGMKKGSEIAQSIILHQNRWRKVEEELPETNVDVLLKFDNGNVSIGVYCKDEFEEYFSCINGDEYSISEVTEWKPIE